MASECQRHLRNVCLRREPATHGDDRWAPRLGWDANQETGLTMPPDWMERRGAYSIGGGIAFLVLVLLMLTMCTRPL